MGRKVVGLGVALETLLKRQELLVSLFTMLKIIITN
jgi:hypothetical protein